MGRFDKEPGMEVMEPPEMGQRRLLQEGCENTVLQ
jgi:hypothetical protein